MSAGPLETFNPSHDAAPRKLTGAEALVACLESAGVEVMFGLCGHTNIAMLAALEKSSIRYVGVRHEQVATHAADGYFRSSGKLAAVLTTIGPGLTNAITGIGDAALDGAGMVVIAGDVPSYLTGRDAFQELALHGDAQQIELVAPIVKRAWRVSRREVLVHDALRAINLATSGRPGPVLLDVPLDYFSEPLVEAVPTASGRVPTHARPLASADAIAEITQLLASAKAPVILAGGGAASSAAGPSLVNVAELIGAPVVTTLSGQGVIDKEHLLSAGYIATVGTPVAHQLINTADVLLVLGTQLAEMETSSFTTSISLSAPPTKLIQVDLDPAQLGKHYPVEVGVVADVRAFLDQLAKSWVEKVPAREWRDEERIQAYLAHREEWLSEIREASLSDSQPIVVERLLADIRRSLPREGFFLTDVGIRHQVAQQFPVDRPEAMYIGSGWGTMGGAVAAALGTKLANPDAAVLAEVGDGAFSSVLSAVVTAVEHEIGVVWVVMNNFGYSSISVYQKKHEMGSLGTTFKLPTGQSYNPDFAALARACGAEGTVVTDPAELLPTLEKALQSGRPWVLDVHTEQAPRTRASGYWDLNGVFSGENFAGGRG